MFCKIYVQFIHIYIHKRIINYMFETIIRFTMMKQLIVGGGGEGRFKTYGK